ncbi:MAG: hypothetical protein ACTSX6_04720 [Candidatus Heimdallarchaeaceae archaeon]
MGEYDKIWIEVDVNQDRDKKTEMLNKIMNSLDKLDFIKNIAKVTYVGNIKKMSFEAEE